MSSICQSQHHLNVIIHKVASNASVITLNDHCKVLLFSILFSHFLQIYFIRLKNKLLKTVEISAYVQFNDVVTCTDTRCALLLAMCDFLFSSLE